MSEFSCRPPCPRCGAGLRPACEGLAWIKGVRAPAMTLHCPRCSSWWNHVQYMNGTCGVWGYPRLKHRVERQKFTACDVATFVPEHVEPVQLELQEAT